MRDMTKNQLGSNLIKQANDYWNLKKSQGLPDEFEQPVKFAFMKGWTQRDSNRKEI